VRGTNKRYQVRPAGPRLPRPTGCVGRYAFHGLGDHIAGITGAKSVRTHEGSARAHEGSARTHETSIAVGILGIPWPAGRTVRSAILSGPDGRVWPIVAARLAG
jgi:hypothetical protein